MLIHKLLILLLSLSLPLVATVAKTSFKDAAEVLAGHSSVVAIEKNSQGLKERGEVEGSWGDPQVSVAFKNFPRDTLASDETPMTGIEFGVAQKIALTPKYARKQKSWDSFGDAEAFAAKDHYRELLKNFWQILITEKLIREKRKVFKENLNSISKILKTSKRLYANGRGSQQAVLDIQIRKTEIESGLQSLGFERSQVKDQLSYLLGEKAPSFDYSSTPWKKLLSLNTKAEDFKEKSLKAKVQAKNYQHQAMQLNMVPDIQVKLGYTKRSNIDGRGDFVSAMISLPLPFSQTKYAGKAQAYYEKESMQKSLVNYQRFKENELSVLSTQIARIQNELEILNQKTLRFAENSQKITYKSYALGNSSYNDLLQSDLKLQELYLKRINFQSSLEKAYLSLKFLKGEKLYE